MRQAAQQMCSPGVSEWSIPLIIDRLDHINIAAPAGLLVKVRDFYVDILGLEDGARPEFSSPGYWLYAGKDPLIHLSERDGGAADGSNGCLDHVAFRGHDLKAMSSRLESAGVEFQLTQVPGLNLSQLFFRDPAGVRVEINFRSED